VYCYLFNDSVRFSVLKFIELEPSLEAIGVQRDIVCCPFLVSGLLWSCPLHKGTGRNCLGPLCAGRCSYHMPCPLLPFPTVQRLSLTPLGVRREGEFALSTVVSAGQQSPTACLRWHLPRQRQTPTLNISHFCESPQSFTMATTPLRALEIRVHPPTPDPGKLSQSEDFKVNNPMSDRPAVSEALASQGDDDLFTVVQVHEIHPDNPPEPVVRDQVDGGPQEMERQSSSLVSLPKKIRRRFSSMFSSEAGLRDRDHGDNPAADTYSAADQSSRRLTQRAGAHSYRNDASAPPAPADTPQDRGRSRTPAPNKLHKAVSMFSIKTSFFRKQDPQHPSQSTSNPEQLDRRGVSEDLQPPSSSSSWTRFTLTPNHRLHITRNSIESRSSTNSPGLEPTPSMPIDIDDKENAKSRTNTNKLKITGRRGRSHSPDDRSGRSRSRSREAPKVWTAWKLSENSREYDAGPLFAFAQVWQYFLTIQCLH
jgi:hypothetical protein